MLMNMAGEAQSCCRPARLGTHRSPIRRKERQTAPTYPRPQAKCPDAAVRRDWTAFGCLPSEPRICRRPRVRGFDVAGCPNSTIGRCTDRRQDRAGRNALCCSPPDPATLSHHDLRVLLHGADHAEIDSFRKSRRPQAFSSRLLKDADADAGSRKKIRSVNANVETAMAFVNQKNLPVIRRDAAGAAAGPLAERGALAAVLPVRWYSSKPRPPSRYTRRPTRTTNRWSKPPRPAPP